MLSLKMNLKSDVETKPFEYQKEFDIIKEIGFDIED